MTALHSIQLFVVINLFIIGFSHFVQPKMWISFFQYLHQRRPVGNIFDSLIALGMGSIIISFHLVWDWPMILITLYGLSQTLKAALYLIFPDLGLKSIAKVKNAP